MENTEEQLYNDLQSADIYINDIYELVNTNKSYIKAIPILISYLNKDFNELKVKEGIVRALTLDEAKGKANKVLIHEYNETPYDKRSYRWAIGNAFYKLITFDDLEALKKIVSDKNNGISRQMFVSALGKVNSQIAESILIELLNDDEVAAHALNALKRLKSKKAIDAIKKLVDHKNRLVRSEAIKTLETLEKL